MTVAARCGYGLAMRMSGLVVVLVLLIAAPAQGHLKRSVAQRYAEDRFALLVVLYDSPTPAYTFGRCKRATPDRFRCRFVIHYGRGNPYRGHLDVVRHRHVKPGFTRMGWMLPPVPEPPA